MKNAVIILAILIVAGFAVFFLYRNFADTTQVSQEEAELADEQEADQPPGDAEPPVPEQPEGQSVIGASVEGRDITAHHFGDGNTELLFVGGIHGGYSWNTALVGHELVDYLEENSEVVPENVRVTVVPVLNPDGLAEVVGTSSRFSKADVPASQAERVPGRFNANNVDLNRNFDCDWQENATWQSREVSGGTSAFSEPESQAMRDYVALHDPDAVVVYYSAAGGVFASNCHGGVLPETSEILQVYADASGYRAFQEYDYYEITGDMTNWLASVNVPAISVLLTNHEDVEWPKNRAGARALLQHYAAQVAETGTTSPETREEPGAAN